MPSCPEFHFDTTLFLRLPLQAVTAVEAHFKVVSIMVVAVVATLGRIWPWCIKARNPSVQNASRSFRYIVSLHITHPVRFKKHLHACAHSTKLRWRGMFLCVSHMSEVFKKMLELYWLGYRQWRRRVISDTMVTVRCREAWFRPQR